MNGMRRRIAGKTPAEIREMAKIEMKDPVTMEDFMQVCAHCYNGWEVKLRLRRSQRQPALMCAIGRRLLNKQQRKQQLPQKQQWHMHCVTKWHL